MRDLNLGQDCRICLEIWGQEDLVEVTEAKGFSPQHPETGCSKHLGNTHWATFTGQWSGSASLASHRARLVALCLSGTQARWSLQRNDPATTSEVFPGACGALPA